MLRVSPSLSLSIFVASLALLAALVWGPSTASAQTRTGNYRLYQVVEYEAAPVEGSSAGFRAVGESTVRANVTRQPGYDDLDIALNGEALLLCLPERRSYKTDLLRLRHERGVYSTADAGVAWPVAAINSAAVIPDATGARDWTQDFALPFGAALPSTFTLTRAITVEPGDKDAPGFVILSTTATPFDVEGIDGLGVYTISFRSVQVFEDRTGELVHDGAVYTAIRGLEAVVIERSLFATADGAGETPKYVAPDAFGAIGYKDEAFQPQVVTPLSEWALQAVKGYVALSAAADGAAEKTEQVKTRTGERVQAFIPGIAITFDTEMALSNAHEMWLDREGRQDPYANNWVQYETVVRGSAAAGPETEQSLTTRLIVDKSGNRARESTLGPEDLLCVPLGAVLAKYGVISSALIWPWVVGGVVVVGAGAAVAASGGGGGSSGDGDPGETRQLPATGRLRSGGVPVEGIRVVALSIDGFTVASEAISDQQGFFNLRLPEGFSGTIEPQPPAGVGTFTPEFIRVTNAQADIFNLNFEFSPSKSLARVAIDLAGVALSVEPTVVVTGDKTGRPAGDVELAIAPGTAAELRAEAGVYTFSPASLRLRAGERRDVTFTLNTVVVRGRVATTAGDGVEGAILTARDSAGTAAPAVAVSRADGAFAFTLPRGWQGTVTIRKAGYSLDGSVIAVDSSDAAALANLVGELTRRPEGAPVGEETAPAASTPELEFELLWEGAADLDLRIKTPGGRLITPANSTVYLQDSTGAAAGSARDRVRLAGAEAGSYEVTLVLDAAAGDVAAARVRILRGGREIAASPVLTERFDLTGRGEGTDLKAVLVTVD